MVSLLTCPTGTYHMIRFTPARSTTSASCGDVCGQFLEALLEELLDDVEESQPADDVPWCCDIRIREPSSASARERLEERPR